MSNEKAIKQLRQMARQLDYARESIATCKSCGAAIFWAKSATTGKAMPINARPDPQGNISLDLTGAAVVGKAGVDLPGPRYVSHFVTCPQHEKWRKT